MAGTSPWTAAQNAVHGEEEAKLVLSDHFQYNNEFGSKTSLQGEGAVEDPYAIHMNPEQCVPSIHNTCFRICAGPGWCFDGHRGSCTPWSG